MLVAASPAGSRADQRHGWQADERIITHLADGFQMGWMPAFSDGIATCQVCGVRATQRRGRHPWKKVTIIGVDLAKNVFVHGATAHGSVVFRKKLSRLQFCRFMAGQPPCVVAMEACAGSHYWAREMARLGHHPKLIAPRYVKAFIKRQKNHAADAEAIVEAAQRPTMRFVEPKTEEHSLGPLCFAPENSWSISALSW